MPNPYSILISSIFRVVCSLQQQIHTYYQRSLAFIRKIFTTSYRHAGPNHRVHNYIESYEYTFVY
jgi:hypothetical protein